MAKIKSVDELRKLRDQLKGKLTYSGKDEEQNGKAIVRVALATCSNASGARETMTFFKEEIEKRGINAVVTQTGCMGYCYAEPTVEVTLPGKEPFVFGYVNVKKADEIIEKYIRSGELIDGIIPMNYQNIDQETTK